MAASTDALAAARKYLGAVEVAPLKFAWRGPEFEAYVVADASVLLMSDYSGWVAAIEYNDPVLIMPDWWSPEGQVYCHVCHHASPHTDQICYCSAPCDCEDCGGYDEDAVVNGFHPCCCDRTALERGQLVTVNLSTGEEVPVASISQGGWQREKSNLRG